MQVLRELVHPNLVNYEELFLERNYLMLAMEFLAVKKEKTRSKDLKSCEKN